MKNAAVVTLAIGGLMSVLAWAGPAHPARFQPKVALVTYDVPAGVDAGVNVGGA